MNWFWKKNKDQATSSIEKSSEQKEKICNTYLITMKDKTVISHTSLISGTIDITDGNLFFYDAGDGIELIVASGEWVDVIQKEYADKGTV
jgi:hypothetical protein